MKRTRTLAPPIDVCTISRSVTSLKGRSPLSFIGIIGAVAHVPTQGPLENCCGESCDHAGATTEIINAYRNTFVRDCFLSDFNLPPRGSFVVREILVRLGNARRRILTFVRKHRLKIFIDRSKRTLRDEILDAPNLMWQTPELL